MKFYLAARYSAQERMRECASDLANLGHRVMSSWITGKHDGWQSGPAALEDVQDLAHSDCVISFTEEPRTLTDSRGGRHVEFGMAWAFGKRLIIVGWRENVFHHLPNVEFYPNWPSALAEIARLPRELDL